MKPVRETITNEELAELPIARFEGQITVVDSEEQIPGACAYLLGQPRIGFDTETRPSFKPGAPMNRVALLQLSGPDRAFLFRLNCIPFHPALLELLTSPDVLKIGAAVPGDLHALQQVHAFVPGGFVDLQSVVRTFGIDELSVRKMSAIVLGARVSKAQRLSNWEAVTLTPAQQMYAATDAWICLEIHSRLMSADPAAATVIMQPAPPEKKQEPRPRRRPRRRAGASTKPGKPQPGTGENNG